MKKLLLLLFTLLNFKAFTNTPPVRFIENKGQWDKDVKFVAQIPGGVLQVKTKGLHYIFLDNEAIYNLKHGDKTTSPNLPLKAHGLDVFF